MTILHRYNRPKALQSAAVEVSDNLLRIDCEPSVPDPDFQEVGVIPMVAGPSLHIEMTLADLKALREFDDGAMLSFDTTTATPDAPVDWHNLYIGTMLGRRPMLEYLVQVNWNTPIRILVPARGISSFKQCCIVIQMHDETKPLTCNEPVALMEAPNFLGLQFVPEITGPTSVPAGEAVAAYSVQLRDYEGLPVRSSGTIYLEATAGNLNRHRVELDEQGQGSFELLTAGLAPGDRVKLKAGFRYFPGAFDHIVTLT